MHKEVVGKGIARPNAPTPRAYLYKHSSSLCSICTQVYLQPKTNPPHRTTNGCRKDPRIRNAKPASSTAVLGQAEGQTLGAERDTLGDCSVSALAAGNVEVPEVILKICQQIGYAFKAPRLTGTLKKK